MVDGLKNAGGKIMEILTKKQQKCFEKSKLKEEKKTLKILQQIVCFKDELVNRIQVGMIVA